MERGLSAQDEQFRQEMREFFTTAIPEEIRAKAHTGEELTKDDIATTHRALHAAGMAVPAWPVEWGGKDWTNLQRYLWFDEPTRRGPGAARVQRQHDRSVIAAFGSAEMKARFLPPTAALDIWWCQGFSEPEAGSDLASLRTTAVRDGDEYVVNGQKTWTTLGQYADWIFALVRTDPQAPKPQQGISMLLIDMTTLGITVRPIQLIDGGYEVNEVFFDNVRVRPTSWSGRRTADGTTRSSSSATSASASLRSGGSSASSPTSRRTRRRSRMPRAPPRRPPRRRPDRRGWSATSPRSNSPSCASPRTPTTASPTRPPRSSKLRGSQIQQDVLELMVDIAGPASLVWEPDDGNPSGARRSAPVYLNFRKASIYGGSNEVQRSVISGGILGLKG